MSESSFCSFSYPPGFSPFSTVLCSPKNGERRLSSHQKKRPKAPPIIRILIVSIISNWPAPLFFPSHLYRRRILRQCFDSPRPPLFFPSSMASRDTIRILHKLTIYETLAKNNHTYIRVLFPSIFAWLFSSHDEAKEETFPYLGRVFCDLVL